MQELINLLMNQGSLGNQIGNRLANQSDPYSMMRLRTDPRFARDQSMQDYLGPLEHQQFGRELGQTSPLQGGLATAAAAPYSAGKALGFAPGGTGESLTSRPSLEEVLRMALGYGQGIRQRF